VAPNAECFGDRIDPWNSRACETINAECLAPELLPCECIMRRPIASLCSAPMALGFDPLLSRFEPRSSFFKNRRCSEIDNAVTLVNAAPTGPAAPSAVFQASRCGGSAMRVTLGRRNQTKCAVPRTSLRYCQEEDRFPEFGTESKFFNDCSRARACACAQGRCHSDCLIAAPLKGLAAR
jgi:hypothetical protein